MDQNSKFFYAGFPWDSYMEICLEGVLSPDEIKEEILNKFTSISDIYIHKYVYVNIISDKSEEFMKKNHNIMGFTEPDIDEWYYDKDDKDDINNIEPDENGYRYTYILMFIEKKLDIGDIVDFFDFQDIGARISIKMYYENKDKAFDVVTLTSLVA